MQSQQEVFHLETLSRNNSARNSATSPRLNASTCGQNPANTSGIDIFVSLKSPVSKTRRHLALLMVFLSLLADNMLLTSIVPIIPALLLKERYEARQLATNSILQKILSDINTTAIPSVTVAPIDPLEHHIPDAGPDAQMLQDQSVVSLQTGFLFGSKALLQLLLCPFVGHLVEKFGPKIPMLVGSVVLLCSTLLFAFGNGFWVFLTARAIQAFGSSCTNVAGMSTLAAYYTDDDERGKAIGMALSGLAFGVLFGPVFGGSSYQFIGPKTPFLILAGLITLNGVMQMLVIKFNLGTAKESKPFVIFSLLRDVRILFTAVTICMGNFGIAILEPNLPLWMETTMGANNFEQGIAFFPSSLAYFLGTNVFGWFGNRFGRRLSASLGMVLLAVSVAMVPFSRTVWQVCIPMSFIGFAIGMVDGTMMPTMGLLVDLKHSSSYGAAFAIADASFSVGFALGPIISGPIIGAIGFKLLVWNLALVTLLTSPVVRFVGNLKQA